MCSNIKTVTVLDAVDTNLVAHCNKLIIATKVAAGETHLSLKQGLKEFGVEGKSLDVLHLQKMFAPQNPDGLSKTEQGSLMFLEQKQTGVVKGQLVAN